MGEFILQFAPEACAGRSRAPMRFALFIIAVAGYDCQRREPSRQSVGQQRAGHREETS
jgi:hypothetical protein